MTPVLDLFDDKNSVVAELIGQAVDLERERAARYVQQVLYGDTAPLLKRDAYIAFNDLINDLVARIRSGEYQDTD